MRYEQHQHGNSIAFLSYVCMSSQWQERKKVIAEFGQPPPRKYENIRISRQKHFRVK